MKIAIVGFDTDGQSSYEYFSRQVDDDGRRHTIEIRDQNPDKIVLADIAAILGEDYLNGLDTFDLVVRTSGINPRKILAKNPDIAPKITTQVNEFLKLSPTGNVIGVTGTKGKGTTSTLIARMLEAMGKTVRLGGNIGVPPLSFIEELDADSWVVLELSSFQLADIRHSPHIGVCLMVVPEHLDWHDGLEDYITAKEQLFARQATADVAIYYHDNETSQRIASAGQAQKIAYYHSPGAEVAEGAIVIDGQQICRTDELKLLGQHNWQNVCAAVTAVWYSCLEVCGPAQRPDIGAMREVLINFSGLEHRLELVRILNGVKYYDDSFGTTPETAIVALQAFSEPKVIILGGSDKGAEYADLARVVKGSHVRSALLIGNQAGRLQAALEAVGFTDFQPGGSTMAEIVARAAAVARPGDIVLLSTACASFDMFDSYKDRAAQFVAAVKALPEPAAIER